VDAPRADRTRSSKCAVTGDAPDVAEISISGAANFNAGASAKKPCEGEPVKRARESGSNFTTPAIA